MQYHKQLVQHRPDIGQYGDCFRTALGCLLDMPPADVPHFHASPASDDILWPQINTWLREAKGFGLYSVAYDCSLAQVLEMQRVLNPDIFYLLCGASPRGTNHQVIACGDKIVHDPASAGGGLVGPCDDGYFWVNVLVPSCHLHKS